MSHDDVDLFTGRWDDLKVFNALFVWHLKAKQLGVFCCVVNLYAASPILSGANQFPRFSSTSELK